MLGGVQTKDVDDPSSFGFQQFNRSRVPSPDDGWRMWGPDTAVTELNPRCLEFWLIAHLYLNCWQSFKSRIQIERLAASLVDIFRFRKK